MIVDRLFEFGWSLLNIWFLGRPYVMLSLKWTTNISSLGLLARTKALAAAITSCVLFIMLWLLSIYQADRHRDVVAAELADLLDFAVVLDGEVLLG